MFSWLNLSNLQTCDLNDSMVNWLGVERESLSIECADKLPIPRGDRNSTTKINKQQKLDFSYRSTK